MMNSLTSHLNDCMTHKCISEKCLLLPRHPRQLAAFENLKSLQISRNVVHDSHEVEICISKVLVREQLYLRKKCNKYTRMLQMNAPLINTYFWIRDLRNFVRVGVY